MSPRRLAFLAAGGALAAALWAALDPSRGGLAVLLLHRTWLRLQLSRAKHRSLAGHSRLSRRLACWLPFYD